MKPFVPIAAFVIFAFAGCQPAAVAPLNNQSTDDPLFSSTQVDSDKELEDLFGDSSSPYAVFDPQPSAETVNRLLQECIAQLLDNEDFSGKGPGSNATVQPPKEKVRVLLASDKEVWPRGFAPRIDGYVFLNQPTRSGAQDVRLMLDKLDVSGPYHVRCDSNITISFSHSSKNGDWEEVGGGLGWYQIRQEGDSFVVQ